MLVVEDPDLLVHARVAERRADEKPVELRLGERVRAVLLDRVLRRDQEKRIRQRPRRAVDGHLQLRHALEERGLRLRECTVDLVDENDVREDRTGPELELARERAPDREARHVRRLEVRRALDPRHGGLLDAAGEGAREDGLCRPGHVLEEHVATACEGGDDEANRLLFADDNGLDIRKDPLRDCRADPDGIGRHGRRTRPGRAHPQPFTAGPIGSIVGEAQSLRDARSAGTSGDGEAARGSSDGEWFGARCSRPCSSARGGNGVVPPAE